jgi:predicted ArsR family transcriptional regulator
LQTVRRRITEILKERGPATVAELAGELDMAQVSVRHHIDILVGEDLVELSGLRRQNGAGRPSQLYGLTAAAVRLFPQRCDALAGGMLRELKAALPPSEVRAVLYRMAERSAHEAEPPPEGASVEEQLELVAGFLCQKGYAARWEACDDHYELHACNCPYAGVADQHHELCAMDLHMMQNLLPEAIRLQTRAIDGASRCTYVIHLQPGENGAHPSQDG